MKLPTPEQMIFSDVGTVKAFCVALCDAIPESEHFNEAVYIHAQRLLLDVNLLLEEMKTCFDSEERSGCY